jgi:hypothetical protein
MLGWIQWSTHVADWPGLLPSVWMPFSDGSEQDCEEQDVEWEKRATATAKVVGSEIETPQSNEILSQFRVTRRLLGQPWRARAEGDAVTPCLIKRAISTPDEWCRNPPRGTTSGDVKCVLLRSCTVSSREFDDVVWRDVVCDELGFEVGNKGN